MARQNERKMKLYMEAGLAVLLVLTIALHQYQGGSLRRHMRRTRISRKRLYKEKRKFTKKTKEMIKRKMK